MKKRPVIQLGNPVLRAPGRVLTPQEICSSEMQKLMDVMIITMYAEDGVGIAAQQVGEALMLAIVSHVDGDLVVCNPRILRRSIRKQAAEEGCLSVRGVFGIVKRHRHIRVAFLDRNAKEVVMGADGLLARVFQHEIDHLQGHVFIDRTKKITQGMIPKT